MRFVEEDSQQTQIVLSFPSVALNHPQHYAAELAVEVLSGGMSSRLFTEVREKRGLCYSVNATLTQLHHTGAILCYAGTTPDRAQETLDVLRETLRQFPAGLDERELNRSRTRAKSSLIMASESASARSGALAGQWVQLGRVVSLQEQRRELERVTTDDIAAYWKQFPASKLTTLVMGSRPLE